MKATSAGNKEIHFGALPKSYRELCMVYLPRPIHNRREYLAAEKMAAAMAGWEEAVTEDQKDYFDIVTDMMCDYDETARPYSPEVSPTRLLKSLLEENRLSAADLSRILGADRTLGSKILSGARSITAAHARKLAAHFKLDAGAFV